MISVSLDLCDRAGLEPARFFYCLAHRVLACDTSLPELAAFATAPPASLEPPQHVTFPAPDPAILTYEGPGLLGGCYRTFHCWALSSGYNLAIDGVGLFSIGTYGSDIKLLQESPGATRSLIGEAALGPALILALAMSGTWSLHASAVVWNGRVVAFVGESGNGKSTLARFLASQRNSGFSHLSDDILPVTLSEEGLLGLPRFPQLKMAPDAQPSVSHPERLPLACVYLLKPPSATITAPEIKSLGSARAALTLVRHTVASRLFAQDLLAQHLHDSSAASTLVPLRRLSLPHGLPQLTLACDVLSADLSRPAS